MSHDTHSTQTLELEMEALTVSLQWQATAGLLGMDWEVIITISNFQPGTVAMMVVVVYTVHKTIWEAGGITVVPFPA